MKEYHVLTEDEILKYRSMLKLPNIEFPHYEHLIIDGKIIYQYIEEKLLNNEVFRENEYFKDNYNLKLEISNYGRIKINNEFKIPEIEKNTFKHGLKIYINKDWSKKSIHRLVKETFDPIFEMDKREGGFMKYEVHHLNNNGNDNRLENLLWVTREDHKKIDSEFNKKLMDIAKTIILNNKDSNYAGVLDIDSEESRKKFEEWFLMKI